MAVRGADPAARHAGNQVVRRDVDVYRQIDPIATTGEGAVERLGLASGPGEPVEDGAERGIVGGQSLQEDTDDRIVGHELSAAHVAVRRRAESRARRDGRPQQIARGEDGNSEPLCQHRRLRPLAGAGSAEEDDHGHSRQSPALARPVQGGVEHESERTPRCVSERAETTTPEWPVRAGGLNG